MEDLLKAFIEFLTDLFAALGEFLGGEFVFGDIISGIEDVLGGEETTDAVTE